MAVLLEQFYDTPLGTVNGEVPSFMSQLLINFADRRA